MKCPSCKDRNLIQTYTEQGVEIDSCPKCRGIWLDKGEIFYFTQKPSQLQKELDEAIKQWKPSEKICPRTGKQMDEIKLLTDQLVLDYSPHSKGIWFDGEEFEKLTRNFGARFKLKIDRKTASSSGKDLPFSGATTRPVLPNLFLQSIAVLVFLYGLLTTLLITFTICTDMPPVFALVIGIIIVAVQFIWGPFLTDLSLRWMYQMSWITYERLPGLGYGRLKFRIGLSATTLGVRF